MLRRAERSWASLTAAAISRCEGPLLTWTPVLEDLARVLSVERLAMKLRLTLSGCS